MLITDLVLSFIDGGDGGEWVVSWWTRDKVMTKRTQFTVSKYERMKHRFRMLF